MIHVLIVDDHKLVREGITLLVHKAKDIRIVSEARDGFEAITLAEQLQPDVILLDIEMPKLNGLRALQRVSEVAPRARILMLSMRRDEESVRASFNSGAHGYLLKDSGRDELIQAIHDAHNGLRVVSPSVSDFFSTGAADPA